METQKFLTPQAYSKLMPTAPDLEWLRLARLPAPERFSEIGLKQEGAEAIFIEHPTILHVHVSNIVADDWGVKTLITCIPAPGLGKLGTEQRDSCQIAAAWDVLSFDSCDWHARYIPWDLIFDSVLIENVKALAANVAQQGKLLTRTDAMLAIFEYRKAKQQRERRMP